MTGGPASRVFGLPPGADFPRDFAQGLAARLAGMEPGAVARVTVIANSSRTVAALRPALAAAFGPAALLPKLLAVTDLADWAEAPVLPPPVPEFRRLTRLAELVRAFLVADDGHAPVTARFDLARSLAALLDEMEGAGLDPAGLEGLDLGTHAEHWERSRRFLGIVARAWPLIRAGEEGGRPDAALRLRCAVEALAARWAIAPPSGPVIVAGSTGSRPATLLLMTAVAGLDAGALVLPGFDAWLPADAWRAAGPEHPQAAIAGTLAALGLSPAVVRPWHGSEPLPARNRLISLALRPAPVTDAWLGDLPALLPELAAATAGITLIEARTPREEALALALLLRETLERPGERAALITPDRALARQVTAALDRWELRPDDAAGRPLALTPPGVFLRLVARLAGTGPSAEPAISLLSHPYCGGEGAARREHMRLVGALEATLRRDAVPAPDAPFLARWAEAQGAESRAWAEWLGACLDALPGQDEAAVAAQVARLRAAALLFAGGIDGDGGRLWRRADGEALRALLDRVEAEAAPEARAGAGETARLLDALLDGVNVPPADPAEAPDPRLVILGNREARIERAEVTILAGLNEGVWPAHTGADPWLSRPMRAALGLAPPERQVGLAAHDFATAAGSPRLVLSRAARVGGTATIASRWLIRLGNLMQGAGGEGVAAWAAMLARGAHWLDLARALDRPEAPVAAEPRPAPRPPVALRPRALPVTRIGTLVRDPYAIYAERILRLRPLDALGRLPDARERGEVLHRVLERFIRETMTGLPADAAALFDRIAAEAIDAGTPWPALRRLWRGHLLRARPWFLAREAARRAEGRPLALEARGTLVLDLPGGPFTLSAKADRIDLLGDGRLAIFDYKTGTPPTAKQERVFDRQLWLEAAMAEAGAFAGLAATPVARMTYLGVTGAGEGGKERGPVPEAGAVAQERAHLEALLAAWDDPETPYSARRLPAFAREAGDYDHLARRAEWDTSDGEGSDGD